jgi:hypothetical protein
MVMGTVLTAPQRMRRTQGVDPGIALIGDILNLATRLAQDTEQGGRIAEVARAALEESLEALVRQRLSKMESAGPKLASWLLRVLRATTGLGPVADFLEFAGLMVTDAQARSESCGGHFREESQTAEGEAQRKDDEFSYVSAWEFTDVGQPATLHKEPLEFEYVKPVQRSYK